MYRRVLNGSSITASSVIRLAKDAMSCGDGEDYWGLTNYRELDKEKNIIWIEARSKK